MRTDPKRVQAVFLSAVEVADPAARTDLLGRECGADSELRRRVEALLVAHDEPGSLLERPAGSSTGAEAVAGARPVPNLDETQGDPQGDREAPALGFLRPSTKPGSLGRLGHYEVLEVLGQGGFGIVLKAFDEMLHRVVAIKVMAAHLASTSPARSALLREARALAAVRHENVVAIHAVEEQPIPYLVMEYIAGRTLQETLDDKGPLEVPEVLRLGQQIARGLAAAHARGLIHRDIKPANILIEAGVERQVKITDFGLARAADDASLTQSGVIAGTPMYMAPEQAQGEVIDQRADLFSLGSVLYVMCTGRPPFRASTTLGVLKRVAEDTPRPIREIIPEVPESLCAIVARLHAKNPADRFASAKEVAEALARHPSDLQSPGVRAMTTPAPVIEESPRVAPPSPPMKASSSARGRLWWAVAAGVLATGVLAAVAVAVMLLFTAGGQDRRGVGKTPPPLAVAPFDEDQAKTHQEAWAKYLGVPVEVTDSIGMKLRLIPPGEYLMGSSPKEIEYLLTEAPDLKDSEEFVKTAVRAEGPQRRVEVKEPFYEGAHEVTVGQFREFIRATGYRTEAEVGKGGVVWNDQTKNWDRRPEYVWSHPDYSGNATYPVVFVTLADARAFCAWASKREGQRYDVPTEEQWEWACRAGTTTRWFFGDNESAMSEFGWTAPHSEGKIWPVGRLAANPFGLFDVHGNVSELAVNSRGKPVSCGGESGVSPLRARSAWRWGIDDPSDSMYRLGFRVVAEATTSVAKRPPDATAPFDAAQARAHQVAWAIHLVTKVELTNSLGMKLALIPPGKFLMGSPDVEEGRYADEGPQHEVTITKPFYMGVHDVTVGQFAAFVKATGYKTEAETSGLGSKVFVNDKWSIDPQADWRKPGFQQTDDNPVVCVSWNDAKAFCDWLSEKEGKKYALPTEAQWESSCRAGSTTKAYFGDDDTVASQYVWYNQNAESKSHPVGQKKPNAWGLYDMTGNVWQWTADWYAADYYQRSPKTDPTGPRPSRVRALRGPGYGNGLPDCRSACRLVGGHPPAHCGSDVGFRVVLLP